MKVETVEKIAVGGLISEGHTVAWTAEREAGAYWPPSLPTHKVVSCTIKSVNNAGWLGERVLWECEIVPLTQAEVEQTQKALNVAIQDRAAKGWGVTESNAF